MITLHHCKDQALGVFGLGKAGEATVASLLAGGALVFAWDDGEASREALRKKFPQARLLPVAQWPWETLKALVLGPGVPFTHPAPHPAVRLAHSKQCPVIGDVELLFQAQPEATYVGITGTNGKSTTTTLTAHVLKACGKRVEVGGNLGTPALALEPLGAGEIYVLELSSYQLDLVRSTRFNVAALLNITPDHLDRHGTMAGYIAAKLHLFERQQAGDVAVIAVDDEHTKRIAQQLPFVVDVSADGPVFDHITGIATLPGRHNAQNAAVAYAIAQAVGCKGEAIIQAMRSFPGLAHRLELVGEINGVRFINDSKATNADATQHALAAFDHIYWIAGGKAKAGGIETLSAFFPRITHAFLIGDAEDAFAQTLEGKVKYTRCQTLENAVNAAVEMAPRGAVVLLSPACASFDQFKNFEERGDCFRNLVAGLASSALHPPASAAGSHAS